MLNTVAIVLALTAAFSYINHRWLRWPMTIGVMAIALGVSLAAVALDWAGFGEARGREWRLVSSIDFSQVLMEGMLSFLLFAGALHVDLGRLRRVAWQVSAFAVLGTALTMLLIGFGTWGLLGLLGLGLPLAWCLLFGALISPTDPIAVLEVLKSAAVPEELEATIAGESLVNDGVGVVLFALVLDMLQTGDAPTVAEAVYLFLREAVGGAALGIALGWGIYRVLRTIDEAEIEVLITIAGVLGGYALAHALHVSGPLAMVAVGLLIGNTGRAFAMSDRTRETLDVFWHLVDQILNGVLFVLIGLEFALVAFPRESFAAVVIVIALCLLARFVVVGLPVRFARQWIGLPAGSDLVLTWCGVRGGISVALALSLPAGTERDVVLMLTYAVVVFSILVQGLTVARVARRVLG